MSDAKPFEYIKFRKVDEKAIQMLSTGECYYSSPCNFNDPLDCAYSLENFPENLLDTLEGSLDQDTFSEVKKLIDKKIGRIEHFGVVSFCGRVKNKEIKDPILSPDLWGHYADDHKGICIGFSPIKEHKFFNIITSIKHEKTEHGFRYRSASQPGGVQLAAHFFNYTLDSNNILSAKEDNILQVQYNDDFSLPSPDWDKVITNFENLKVFDQLTGRELLDILLRGTLDMKDVVSNKHKSWCNENEYRLFGKKNKSHLIGAAISSVTFGLNVSESTVRYIISILARFYGIYTIELYKMAVNEGSLVRVPMEIYEGNPCTSSSTKSFWQ